MTLGTPIAVVSLVDRDRQWFKSRQGTDTVETPRNISFCTHTIQKDEPLVVPNALDDPRFRDSPLVTCENGVRLYIGMPLRTPDGYNIGALCAIDTKPGTVSSDQVDVLRDLARLVVDELELRKLATVDSLTGAMTGRSFALESKRRSPAPATIRTTSAASCSTSITSRKSMTRSAMQPATRFCAPLPRCAAMRCGRATFLAASAVRNSPSCSRRRRFEETLQIAERLRERLAATPIAYAGGAINVTASLGVTRCPRRTRIFKRR